MSSTRARRLSYTADTSTPVLVLRRNMGPFQHGVLAIARSLGRLRVPVYSARLNQAEPATRSRYHRGGLELPFAGSDEDWIEALLGLSRRHPGAVLLPVDDRSAVAVGDHQQRLAEHFRVPAQPDGLQRRLASKRELWELCRELDLATPESRFPQSEQDLVADAAEFGYPVVLKRAEPWLPPRDPDAPSVFIAHTPDQLLRAYTGMESAVQPQVMVQDYIPGDSDSVWMFNGYFGAGSECLCGFTGRKLRQRGPRTGPTTLGVCTANATVAEAAARLMGRLEYRGIVDMGFRYDERDGLYKLLDVNPRVGSTFRLFVANNGIDVARAQHLDLTGRAVPPSDTDEGRTWIDEPHDLAVSAQLIREGTFGVAAWWARDDAVPFLAMAANVGARTLRTVTRGGGLPGSAPKTPVREPAGVGTEPGP
jgi:D-aspartate ligase